MIPSLRRPAAAARRLRACDAAIPLLLLLVAAPAAGQPPPPRQQNPSPMVEHTRAHVRLPDPGPDGRRVRLDGPLTRPIELYVPATADASRASWPLLVHFHGAAYVAEHAASAAGYAVAVVNLGAGTGVYERAFTDPSVFDAVLASVDAADAGIATDGVVLSAFSAGHGAVRALLREQRHFERVRGAVLLDGIHTSYVPESTVLAEGGALDTTLLEPYVRLARAAGEGGPAVLITHSEIFPGTFASTTETTDVLIRRLDRRRTPVLAWGPVGMQQLSEVRVGRLLIMGFAGNSAPDHIDHYHGLPDFLKVLDAL